MIPTYLKTFDSPVLTKLIDLTKDWIKLKSIDLTYDEFEELNSIFKDPDYNKRDRFEICSSNLYFNKVLITINGQNGISYIESKYPIDLKKPWYKKL